MARIGISDEHAEAILNHVKQGVVGVQQIQVPRREESCAYEVGSRAIKVNKVVNIMQQYTTQGEVQPC